MIGVIDYGIGNCRAFVNVYKRMNIACKLVDREEALEGISKVILPGVGSFDFAMSKLLLSGMKDELDARVQAKQISVLGVCVGMQMMARGSDEGVADGLDWIPGHIRHLGEVSNDKKMRLPHMGWNTVAIEGEQPLFKGLEHDAWFYYLHSYYFDCEETKYAVASCEYGGRFCCAIQRGNIFGVQFHPEKSHQYGAVLLRNFAEL